MVQGGNEVGQNTLSTTVWRALLAPSWRKCWEVCPIVLFSLLQETPVACWVNDQYEMHDIYSFLLWPIDLVPIHKCIFFLCLFLLLYCCYYENDGVYFYILTKEYMCFIVVYI